MFVHCPGFICGVVVAIGDFGAVAACRVGVVMIGVALVCFGIVGVGACGVVCVVGVVGVVGVARRRWRR